MLVAYDMGLGKTVLTIAAIEHLIDTGEVAGGLVIAPANLKYQWVEMIEKFTDGALVLVVDGTPEQRQQQYVRIRRGEVEYALVNSEQVVNDWNIMRHLDFDFIVLDEATFIKGFRAKRSKRIKRMDARYVIALTGQPIENRAEELFSILEWVDDSVLGRWDIFEQTFLKRDIWGRVKKVRNLPLLHELLEDVMVRKTRDEPEVRAQLPRVAEEVLQVRFDRSGAKLYKVIAAELVEAIHEAIGAGSGFDLWRHYHGTEDNAAQGRVMARLTALRMLCDHPKLLALSANNFDDEDSKAGSAYASELRSRGLLEGVTAAPKFKATMELILNLLEANPANKIVLFSYFKPTLGLFADELSRRNIRAARFQGGMSAREKDTARQLFRTDAKYRVFLSSDAGNMGLDLPEANYLISFDHPWGGGQWEQRKSRIIRLSTEWEAVTVLSMVMQGSIEERQMAMLDQKRQLASAIIDRRGGEKGVFSLDLQTLLDFVQSARV